MGGERGCEKFVLCHIHPHRKSSLPHKEGYGGA